MLEIIDKIVLFISCFIFYLFQIKDAYTLVPMLIVITLSCICTFFENRKINLSITILFAVLCFFYPNLLIYVPVIFYDVIFTKEMYFGFLYLIPILLHLEKMTNIILVYMVLFLLLTGFAKYKTLRVGRLQKEYNLFRDTTKEFEILLKEKNRSLTLNQDYEINVATLNERNRISKEIHDNIGHLLSRSLIQIGALLTITKEEVTKGGLTQLKESISEGMDSIRASIHNIHDESIDLYTSIHTLVKNFTFCSINLDYNIQTTPPLKLKYCFIAIVKEALSNIMKHSIATNVSIVLMEHPIMYQLIIADNGEVSEYTKREIQSYKNSISQNDGMGLKNMIERVSGFDGIINISAESGFQIFITIPKKES